MTVHCHGIAGRPCCSRAQPAATKYTTLDDIRICDACARAWVKYVQQDVAKERDVAETQVRVRTWRSGPYRDIEVLEKNEKWVGVTDTPFLKAGLSAVSFG